MGDLKVYLNGADYTEHVFDVSVRMKLNRVGGGTVTFDTPVSEGDEVKITFDDGTAETPLFLGEVVSIRRSHEGDYIARVREISIRLKRHIWDTVEKISDGDFATWIKKMLSENGDGLSPYIVEPGTLPSGVTFTSKTQYASRLENIENFCKDTDTSKPNGRYDWYIDPATGTFNVVAWRGAETPAVTLAVDQNVDELVFESTKDVFNRITVVGAREGGSYEVKAVAEDATSQATYGVREKVIVVPRAWTEEMAQQIANAVLNYYKEPKHAGYAVVYDEIPCWLGDTIYVQDEDGNTFTVRVTGVQINFWNFKFFFDTEVGGIEDRLREIQEQGLQFQEQQTTEGGTVRASSTDATPGHLADKVDNSTLEVSGEKVQVKPSGIKETHIADGAVTNTKVADGAVTSAKIANGAVTGTKIADGAVTATKIANEAVKENHLACVNSPTVDYVLAYAGNGNFKWVEQASGSGTVDGTGSAGYVTRWVDSNTIGYADLKLSGAKLYYDGNSSTYLKIGYNSGAGVEISSATTSTGIRFVNEGTLYMKLGGKLYIYTGTVARNVRPQANAYYDLGTSSYRWDTVYCVSLNQSSDIGLKDSVEDLGYGLKEVLQMRPVSFVWNEKAGAAAGERSIGLIAQELKEIVPEAVTGERDGEYGIDYGRLVPVLIKAVQELAEKVERLEAELKR